MLLELAFHDNPEDAQWIKENLDQVARILVLALTEYFDIPFFETEHRRPGVVDVSYGNLNIRARPSLDAPVIAQAPDGAPLTILNTADGWHLVDFNGATGYAKADYITLV